MQRDPLTELLPRRDVDVGLWGNASGNVILSHPTEPGPVGICKSEPKRT